MKKLLYRALAVLIVLGGLIYLLYSLYSFLIASVIEISVFLTSMLVALALLVPGLYLILFSLRRNLAGSVAGMRMADQLNLKIPAGAEASLSNDRIPANFQSAAEYTVGESDIRALDSAYLSSYPIAFHLLNFLRFIAVVFAVLLFLLIVLVGESADTVIRIYALILTIAVVGHALMAWWFRRRRLNAAAHNPALTGQFQLYLGPQGLHVQSAHSARTYPWSALRSVCRDGQGRLFLLMHGAPGLVIPMADWESDSSERFLGELRERLLPESKTDA